MRDKDKQKAQIENALKESGGNRFKASQLLGIHTKTMYNRMKRLGIFTYKEKVEALDVEQLIDLSMQGLALSTIGERLGVSASYVRSTLEAHFGKRYTTFACKVRQNRCYLRSINKV